MTKRTIIGLLSLVFFLSDLSSQIKIVPDSVKLVAPENEVYSIPPRPFTAAGTVFGTNIGVWAFDRFITNSDYARINLKTISNNFKTGFVWDEDMFATNLFAHPYHGGLYFNAARSNGMGFWKSIPYSAGGSLMWEFCMENEAPAINDFLATSIGGVCLGEMTFRISDLLIDERTIGFERFGREFLTTVISPINGLNRILSGRATKLNTSKGNVVAHRPAVFYASVGHRIMSDNLRHKNDVINTMSYDLGLYYGDPFDDENEHPYDAFMLKVSGNFLSQQPIIHRLNALGQLYASDISRSNSKSKFVAGLYQHFNFYQSNSQIDHELLYPYKISEAASIGPGLLFKRAISGKTTLLGMMHLSGILLGGSQTDHFRTEKRDYNMGSGFSSKMSWELEFGKKVRLYMTSEDYRIYSWIGSHIPDSDQFVSNSQGDIGNVSLTVARLGFQYIIRNHFLISTESSYNYRRSFYKYYTPSIVEHHVEENKISLGYIF